MIREADPDRPVLNTSGAFSKGSTHNEKVLESAGNLLHVKWSSVVPGGTTLTTTLTGEHVQEMLQSVVDIFRIEKWLAKFSRVS